MIESGFDEDGEDDALAMMNRSAEFIDMSCSDCEDGDESVDYGCKYGGEENGI